MAEEEDKKEVKALDAGDIEVLKHYVRYLSCNVLPAKIYPGSRGKDLTRRQSKLWKMRSLPYRRRSTS